METIQNLKRLIFGGILLMTGLFFTGCNESKAPAQAELEGYWVLKTINDQSVEKAFEGAKPTLEFNFADSTVYGTGGGNRYTGKFSYTNGILSAPNLASTNMLCVEPNQEAEFLIEISNGNNSLSIVDGILTVSRDNKTVLEFVKGEAKSEQPETKAIAPNSENLAGTWTLIVINSKKVSDVFTGADAVYPTIEFDFEKGKIFGTAGCNNYNAAFDLAGDSLNVKPMMMTMKACPDLAGQNEFRELLSDKSTISIPSKNILHFLKKGEICLVFEKK